MAPACDVEAMWVGRAAGRAVMWWRRPQSRARAVLELDAINALRQERSRAGLSVLASIPEQN
jgi:hypothetical protein